ncbi:MAG: NAD(+)/NADH kinase [Oscillospiraceae bacterium]|jgi:NAD+ kinase|nr:NAD(+)/NADH kinase [Oscillospiraceae bacterium]
MNAAVYPNFDKTEALKCTLDVCDILNLSGITVFADGMYHKQLKCRSFVKFGEFDEIVKDISIAVVIGGDGTILKCAKRLIGYDVPLLGINTGRLGFMASLELDEIRQLSRLAGGDYTVTPRMMLEITLGKESFTALNDVIISRLYSKICDFEVYAESASDNAVLIGEYHADGIAFSTPTGSTAYSLSAGGPIIEPGMEAIEMTLLCPHSLFTRPMVFSPERIMRIEHSAGTGPPVYISVDGGIPIEFKAGDSLKIKKSPNRIKLIELKSNAFFDSLNRKLMKEIK